MVNSEILWALQTLSHTDETGYYYSLMSLSRGEKGHKLLGPGQPASSGGSDVSLEVGYKQGCRGPTMFSFNEGKDANENFLVFIRQTLNTFFSNILKCDFLIRVHTDWQQVC